MLGFPCLGQSSFQIGEHNHQRCDGKMAADVIATGLNLGFPLRGVFEWSAHPPQVYPELLTAWNAIIRAALQNKTLPEFGDPQAIAWVNEEKKSGGVACHTLAPPSSHIDDGWCVRSCAKDYCPKDICSNECRASSGANATGQQQEELERQQRQQHRQQEQERERL